MHHFDVRRVSVVFATIALLLVPAIARAATLALASGYSGNPPSLPRIGAGDGAPILEKRPRGFEPEGVSRQDCLDDQRIRFPLVLTDAVADAKFEAWATTGSDCNDPVLRESASRTCWRIAEDLPLTPTPVVDLPVRVIMSGAAPNTPAAPVSTADICGLVDLTNVTVQFLYFDPGTVSSPAASLAFTIHVDTKGPPAPASIEALPGNQRLRVSWSPIGDGGLLSLRGIEVYCAAPAASSDAGADAAPSTACDSSSLAGPDGGMRIPDSAFDEGFLCSMVTGDTTSPIIVDRIDGERLVNGTTYAIAVAASDVFGNVGPVSSAVCATPEQTYDFWTDYKEAGGGAGGGSCSVNAGATSGTAGACTGLGVLVAFAVRSRRRRDQARPIP